MALTREPKDYEKVVEENQSPFWQSARRILKRDTNFRWFLTTRILSQFATMGFAFYIVYALRRFQMDGVTAGYLTATLTFSQTIANAGMGWLGDLVDKRRLMMGLLLALSFSVLLMGYTAQAVIFTPCMIIYSLSYGGLASLQEPIRADYFGTKAFATIQGMSRSVQTVGTFIGPVLAGFLYDLTKSYMIAFGIFAIASLGATLLMFLAKRPEVSES